MVVQVKEAPKLAKISRSQHNVELELMPDRGEIRDRHGRPLALNLRMYSLYANPQKVPDAAAVAEQLSRLTGEDRALLEKRLRRSNRFVWLIREVDEAIARQVMALNVPGLGYLREPRRFYPNGDFATHIIGCVGLDDAGLEGLELIFDKDLRGIPGWDRFIRDAKQRILPSHRMQFLPPVNGYHLTTTIDTTIQYIVEQALDDAMATSNAKAGYVIVMDPQTGEILALANRPSYNPNNVKGVDQDSMRNRTICDIIEPGSCFKIVTAAAAIEEGVVRPDELIDCENGSYRVSTHVLHDHRPHGALTFREVIQLSSNIGTYKLAARLGEERLYAYIRKFGFGQRTGVGLPGEIPGLVHPPEKWSKVSIATIPMGQGIGVTPIQLVSLISTIANGGLWVKPRIVLYMEDTNNQLIRSYDTVEARRVIRQDTAGEIATTLAGAVTKGTGKRARIEGYTVAGKTGTAQKVKPGGGYSHQRFVASFIGFAPVSRPRLSVVVIFDEPYPRYYGGTIAAPVFQKIVSQTLRYLEVPMDNAAEDKTIWSP